MKKLIFSILILTLSFSHEGYSQLIGMNASIYQARGEFDENLDRNPAGISINYLHSIGKSKRLNIGGEMGVAMYSNKTYVINDERNGEISIAEEDCFWSVHVLAQYNLYQTPMAKVYAEGRVGGTTFFSSKTAEEDNTGYEDEFKFHGSSFNMGVGGGVKLNMSGLFRGNGIEHSRIWLDMAATVNSGSSTSYRNAEEGTTSLNAANYTSLTNHINYRIGINYRFGAKSLIASE